MSEPAIVLTFCIASLLVAIALFRFALRRAYRRGLEFALTALAEQTSHVLSDARVNPAFFPDMSELKASVRPGETDKLEKRIAAVSWAVMRGMINAGKHQNTEGVDVSGGHGAVVRSTAVNT